MTRERMVAEVVDVLHAVGRSDLAGAFKADQAGLWAGMVAAQEMHRDTAAENARLREALVKARDIVGHVEVPDAAACQAATGQVFWLLDVALAATRLNAGPHKGEGRGMHQVENGRSTDYYAGVQAGLKSFAWDQDGTDMVGVAGTPLAAALDEVEAIHRAAIGADDVKPDQELPDPEKPGKPGKPDHELPDPERPGRPGDKPDQGLPGKPGDRPKPDHELPEAPDPKGRRR